MKLRFFALAVAIGAATVLSGCANGSSGGAVQPAGSAAPLFDLLPAKYQQSGTIAVGSDISYAPMEYYDTDGTTVRGFDADLAELLGKQLGVTFEFRNLSFDGLVTSLRSSRIDIVMSGMSDTRQRQSEVDFVDYYHAGGVLLVRKGNPNGLRTLADLCGRTVAIQRGTTAEEQLTKQSKTCISEGKDKIEILAFDRETEAMLQVKQGRAVAGMQDYPVAVYNAHTSGGGNDFDAVGEQIDAGPLGIAVAKDNTGLRDALRKALDAVIADGSYRTLVTKHEMPLGAVPLATVNGGT